MMIIDSHVHVGHMLGYHFRAKDVLTSMDRYGIDFALISSIEASEFSPKGKRLPFWLRKNQIRANKISLQLVQDYPDRFRCLLWCEPHFETCDEAFEDLYLSHREAVVGLKFHPFYSRIRMNDPRIRPYLRMAERYHLPVLVHTASDEFSDPKYTYEVAKRFPQVTFIMAHMDLAHKTHRQAFRYLRELDNLYGDTAWVDPSSLHRALASLSSRKILFGSDNPIGGIDTYNHEWYQHILHELPKQNPEASKDILCENAIRIFQLAPKSPSD